LLYCGSMLTLFIHLDNGETRTARALDDSISGDLLVDVLEQAHPGALRTDWGFYDEVPEKVLSPHKTLAQNQVKDQAHLHLFSRVKLVLQVDALDHPVATHEIAPITLTRIFLSDLVLSLRLGGSATNWELVRSGSTQVLDPAKTLGANGVRSGDWLSIRKRVEQADPLTLKITEPVSGRIANLTIFGRTVLRDLLREVIATMQLPATTPKGKAQDWMFRQPGSEKSLDLDNTLHANGLKDGSELEIWGAAIDPELTIKIIAPNGAARDTEAESMLKAGRLLREALQAFSLPEEGKRYRLVDKSQMDKKLDLDRTLGDNGVTDGARLLIQPIVFPWMIAGLVASGFLLLLFVLWFVFRPPIKVEVTADRQVLSGSESSHISAAVRNAKDSAVVWSLSPQVGSISPDGTYTAPASLTNSLVIRVTAISHQDSKKAAFIDLTLSPAISITPASAQLQSSGTLQFTAKVRTDLGTSVQWSVADPSLGTISASGLYQAPAEIPEQHLATVRAIVAGAPQFSAEVVVNLVSAAPDTTVPSASTFQLIPATASILAGKGQHFSVTPEPDGPVQWKVNPGIGVVGADGMYIAPLSVKKDQTVSLSAQSASGQILGTALIYLKASPASKSSDTAVAIITAERSQNGQFILHGENRSGKPVAVNWSISPQFGTISPLGVYTPPTVVEQARDVTVRATSQANPAISVTYLLHVLAAGITVKVSPDDHPTLHAGERKAFTAAVKGTSNTVINWSSMGLGDILPNGVYVAPSHIPAGGSTVRIRATSGADPSKFDETLITLHESPAPAAPKQGTVTWQGRLKRRQTLTILNNVPNIGNLLGAFPAGPIEVRITSGDCDLTTAPSAANSWIVLAVKAKSDQTTIVFSWTSPTSTGH
jgi:hypothetical protein